MSYYPIRQTMGAKVCEISGYLRGMYGIYSVWMHLPRLPTFRLVLAQGKKKIFAEGTKLKKSLHKKGRNWTDAMEMLVNPESFSKPLKFSFVWEILFIAYLASQKNYGCCLVRLLPPLTGFTNQITGKYSHSTGFVFYDDGLCKKLGYIKLDFNILVS